MADVGSEARRIGRRAVVMVADEGLDVPYPVASRSRPSGSLKETELSAGTGVDGKHGQGKTAGREVRLVRISCNYQRKYSV